MGDRRLIEQADIQNDSIRRIAKITNDSLSDLSVNGINNISLTLEQVR